MKFIFLILLSIYLFNGCCTLSKKDSDNFKKRFDREKRVPKSPEPIAPKIKGE